MSFFSTFIYFMKFIASFILPPGLFFVLLMIIGIKLWNKGIKKLSGAMISVVVIFYFLSTNFVAGALLGSLEAAYDQPEKISGDCIIMLGGGATSDTPSFETKGNLCSRPAGRLLAAYEIYRQLKVPIIVSGGQVYADSGTEAVIASRELQRLGVPKADIIIEPDSLNTRQNAMYSQKILESKGLKKPILVTSAFHMERSVLNFEKENIKVVPFPTDYSCNQQQFFHYTKLMPSSSALDDSVTYFREKLRTVITKYFE